MKRISITCTTKKIERCWSIESKASRPTATNVNHGRGYELADSKVSFDEVLNFQGNDLSISYSGSLNEDEMKLTRKFGELATEEFTAKRTK